MEGRPLVAQRIGHGSIKVVLIGDIHGAFEANTYQLAQQLAAHFQANPTEVPGAVSLWIVPTINPDGLATGHRWNSNDVDLNRNADTDLDGCAGNDWSPDTKGQEGDHPGAGGAYPFSEPESRAIRDFTADAWIVVFYHSAGEAVYGDSCRRHAPTARLVEILSAATGYSLPETGWTGYPVTGAFDDYLAGEGVAAATVELATHDDAEFERNLKGVRALLAGADAILWADADRAGAGLAWLSESNTGVWRYAKNSFLHPLALELIEETAYVLDSGRVLALALGEPEVPHPLLAPGDQVEDVRVLEPLDLAVDGRELLVLDRAGDVYRYDPAADQWALDRYGRPSADTSNHFYVALATDQRLAERLLLDPSLDQVWSYASGQKGHRWGSTPQGRSVDLDATGDGGEGSGHQVYILSRATNGPKGSLVRYLWPSGHVAGQQDSAFKPEVELMRPRQVRASSTAVYVLDREGRRLLALERGGGALQAVYQFADRRAVGALWAPATGQATPASLQGTRLILAGRDALYFYGQPQRKAAIDGGIPLPLPQPGDPALLESLRGLAMPIEGARITSSDFQIPGAPRHYRLGVHEGLDFYGYAVGVHVGRNTPVRAVADGVVVRALVDYQPLTAAQAAVWASQCLALGYTPAEVLDGYRGQQVWIEHAGGLISRYAHLGSIAPGIVVGAQVKQGQVIATVGNSGTPESVNGPTGEVHLHLELWVGDHYIGQFMRPIETREWLERILR